MRVILLSLSMAVLAGCSGLPFGLGREAPVAAVETRPVQRPVAPPAGARTAAALDTTTAAEKAEALAAPGVAGERALGVVKVSLGAVAEPGFWLRTSLVSAPGKGRVEVAGGASVAVDLIPGAGSGQMSLAAYRALGLSLTGLPEVTVYGG